MNLLTGHFSGLHDPREEANLHDPLTNVLVIAAAAAIAGAESYEDIVLYGTSKAAWLATLLDLTTSNPNIEPQHGIPSHDTFRHVFSLTHGEAFEQCFAAWTASRADAFEDEIVAIDGKTVRRSFDRSTGQSPLHIVRT